jgi:hypothetical protein
MARKRLRRTNTGSASLVTINALKVAERLIGRYRLLARGRPRGSSRERPGRRILSKAMPDLIASALAATRESRLIEFKGSFDPTSSGEWCELIKDMAAITNSGGGIIVLGLNSRGVPTAAPVRSLLEIDPADITNRIFKYTGFADFDVDIRELQKGGSSLCAFLITAAPFPLVFARPGTYDAGGGKQKSAFGVGTVYFRHGSKSEPGTTDDRKRQRNPSVQEEA